MNSDLESIINEIEFVINKIEGLVSSQLRLIKEGNVTQLQTVIDRKDELLSRISELSQAFEVNLKHDTAQSNETKNMVLKQFEQMQVLLSDIIKNEHTCLRKAMQSKDAVFFNLKKVRHGRRVVQSYSGVGAQRSSDLHWQG